MLQRHGMQRGADAAPLELRIDEERRDGCHVRLRTINLRRDKANNLIILASHKVIAGLVQRRFSEQPMKISRCNRPLLAQRRMPERIYCRRVGLLIIWS